MERLAAGWFVAWIAAAVGSARARFGVILAGEEPGPPASYRLVGDSRAAAGFAKRAASMTLNPDGAGTILCYDASFSVGGRLAQPGSQTVEDLTRQAADDFFRAIAAELEPAPYDLNDDIEDPSTGNRPTWMAVGGAIAVLLIWWFLLR